MASQEEAQEKSKQQWSKCTESSAFPLHNYEEKPNQLPIVYHEKYDMTLYGLEKMHPFDTKKWGKTAAMVKEYLIKNNCPAINLVRPTRPINDDELSLVHSKSFIKAMSSSQIAIAKATELAFFAVTPMSIIRSHLLTPLRYQTAGSVLAGYLALKHGWAINLGGGFHHCSGESAGGFCLFADITLLIRSLWIHVNPSLRIMIVDLDAHQGNGHENDANSMAAFERSKLYIFDMYNVSIYPHDSSAETAINKRVPVNIGIGDRDYLKRLQGNLPQALMDFKPNLIVYNAGTDILSGDRLGVMDISSQGILERDEFVFKQAKKRGASIVMLTSGGYQKSNAKVIADSIINLIEKKIIDFPQSIDSNRAKK